MYVFVTKTKVLTLHVTYMYVALLHLGARKSTIGGLHGILFLLISYNIKIICLYSVQSSITAVIWQEFP